MTACTLYITSHIITRQEQNKTDRQKDRETVSQTDRQIEVLLTSNNLKKVYIVLLVKIVWWSKSL